MNGGLHGDMVRTLNNALAQAVQATAAVEKERDEAIQGRQLMAKSLAIRLAAQVQKCFVLFRPSFFA